MIGKWILVFIVKNLTIIQDGEVLNKIGSSFLLGFLFSPVPFFIERVNAWTMENRVYIAWVLYAILTDWVVGIIKHLKNKDFSVGKNAMGLTIKIGMAVFAGGLFEALPYFMGNNDTVSDILLIITRLTVFLYPAGSAWVNMANITNGKFPPVGWLNRVSKFNESLDINALNKKEE